MGADVLISDPIGNLAGLAALAGSGLAVWRWVLPRARDAAKRRRDVEVAILGRPSIPANRNTAEPEQPELRPLRELVSEVHHEMFPNSGKSLRDDVVTVKGDVASMRSRLEAGDAHFVQHDARFAQIQGEIEQIKRLVGVELHTATEAVGSVAEAAKPLLQVLDTALNATPPAAVPRDDVADLG